ncbi:IPT/TIG domain-containing protein [Nocardia sp.]|uniref:IPT/TIG domain-containing protein n=1 Tax=Nocardia sp. TaxID=1821 RepID=UPI0025826465|nr:IPT/TIG domain-containing protein [Nocardia sp.]
MIAKDGAPTFRPEVQSNDVESWGALEPTRTDILGMNLSVTFTAQETNKDTLSLHAGISLDDIVADATTKEIQYNNPTSPATRYNRFIFGMVDGEGTNQVLILKILPRATVSEIGEQSWSQESILTYNFTLKAKIDEDLGYSMKNVICGPGVAGILADMGFTATAHIPVISGRAPSGNLATAGGEILVLSGDHFTGVTGVTVGGTAVLDYQLVDDNTLSIITPAKSASTVNVVVTNATGPSAGFSVTYA